jgi:hypothetical protein
VPSSRRTPSHVTPALGAVPRRSRASASESASSTAARQSHRVATGRHECRGTASAALRRGVRVAAAATPAGGFRGNRKKSRRACATNAAPNLCGKQNVHDTFTVVNCEQARRERSVTERPEIMEAERLTRSQGMRRNDLVLSEIRGSEDIVRDRGSVAAFPHSAERRRADRGERGERGVRVRGRCGKAERLEDRVDAHVERGHAEGAAVRVDDVAERPGRATQSQKVRSFWRASSSTPSSSHRLKRSQTHVLHAGSLRELLETRRRSSATR